MSGLRGRRQGTPESDETPKRLCALGGSRLGELVARLAAWLLAGALLSGAGCSDQKLDAFVKKVFEPKRTPQQYMLVAVSSEDPDERRDAVARISAARQFNQEWAIKGFIAIALLETDSQTRCVAIRALGRTADPRAGETMLKILNWREQPPAEVRPPDDVCRWDATATLASLLLDGRVPPEQREAVRRTLLDRLKNDPQRHVRIAAARGLGGFADEGSVRGLIAALNDEDFAVVHECENSLVRLTGRTHECNALAWEAWLAGTNGDLFAGRGQIPESRRPPYSDGWGKFAHEARQWFEWLFPGKKE